jgi:hypothetical protein
LGSEFQVNSYTIHDQKIPAVAMDGSGAFVVTWQSYQQDGGLGGFGIHGQRFASGGTPVGSEFLVNTYTNNDQEPTKVFAGAAGDFVVVWSGTEPNLAAGSGVFARRFEAPSCPSTPIENCMPPGKQLLLVKDDAADDNKDKLVWKWLKGTAAIGDFAKPLTLTDYALCVYDGTTRVHQAVVRAGGTCGSELCWTENATGFVYTDPSRTQDGIRKIILKSGPAGKAKALVKGKGSGLGLEPALLPVDEPLAVRAQLINSRLGCWEAELTGAPIANSETLFKAKAP